MSERVFVIAEAGSNHENKITRALNLIATAKDCGADACKFQFWSDPDRLAERRNAPELAQTYTRWRLPESWLPTLKEQCDRFGIEFMCTVYLPEDIPIIEPLVKRFKIASFEAQDDEFFSAHWPYYYRYRKPIIVSTGMMAQRGFGGGLGDAANCNGVLLHCTSGYPCPDEQANIKAIKWMKPDRVGFSDHTMSPIAGAMAVACGAEVVETHFRLHDTSCYTPDFPVSKSPTMLRQYIDNIRQAEVLLGDGHKKIEECERQNLKYLVKNSAETAPVS